MKAYLVTGTAAAKPTTKSTAVYAIFTPARFSTKEVECWKMNSTGGMYKTSYTEWTRTAAANVKLYSTNGTQVGSTITLSSNTSGQYAVGYVPESYVINKAVLKYRPVTVLEQGEELKN